MKTKLQRSEDMDYQIMLARTRAINRGATSAEIQRNVERLEDYE